MDGRAHGGGRAARSAAAAAIVGPAAAVCFLCGRWGQGRRTGRPMPPMPLLAAALATLLAAADGYSVAAGTQQARQVRWWMSFTKPENNLRLIDSHPKAVTGIYTYIGAGVESSGSFDCPHNESFLREQFEPYWARGLSVTPALALTNASVMSGTALKHVAEVAAFAEKINVSGFMLDFEPGTSEVAWVHAYADYVAAFREAMHDAGLQAEMCVSDWGILDGHFLKNGEGYGVYAKTGVDVMMSMAGTYYGSNVTKNLHNVDLEITQGVSLSQLAVGIGTQINPSVAAGCPVVGQMGCHTAGGQCYNWTQSRLETFVADCVSRGVRTIDIWRADIDQEGDCTEPYYFQVAEKFLAGHASLKMKSSIKSVDHVAVAGLKPTLSFVSSSPLSMELPSNKTSYEGGTVIRTASGLHLFTTDTSHGIVNTSLVYYHSSATGNNSTFKYVRQVVCCSEGVLTGHRASLWAPMPVFDADADLWRLFHVQYSSSVPASNSSGWFYNYDGQIASAVSTVKGKDGIGGPYITSSDGPAVVLGPDADSQSWEGLQGTDSISPPFLLRDNETWAAYYGSAQTEKIPRPHGIWWNGLVTTKKLGDRFVRRLPSAKVDLNGGGSENPVVTYLPQHSLYIALFDDLFAEAKGFGFSFSADGLTWETPAAVVAVPGGTRTPMALMLEDDGSLSVFYSNYGVGGGPERIFHAKFELKFT